MVGRSSAVAQRLQLSRFECSFAARFAVVVAMLVGVGVAAYPAAADTGTTPPAATAGSDTTTTSTDTTTSTTGDPTSTRHARRHVDERGSGHHGHRHHVGATGRRHVDRHDHDRSAGNGHDRDGRHGSRLRDGGHGRRHDCDRRHCGDRRGLRVGIDRDLDRHLVAPTGGARARHLHRDVEPRRRQRSAGCRGNIGSAEHHAVRPHLYERFERRRGRRHDQRADDSRVAGCTGGRGAEHSEGSGAPGGPPRAGNQLRQSRTFGTRRSQARCTVGRCRKRRQRVHRFDRRDVVSGRLREDRLARRRRRRP